MKKLYVSALFAQSLNTYQKLSKIFRTCYIIKKNLLIFEWYFIHTFILINGTKKVLQLLFSFLRHRSFGKSA